MTSVGHQTWRHITRAFGRDFGKLRTASVVIAKDQVPWNIEIPATPADPAATHDPMRSADIPPKASTGNRAQAQTSASALSPTASP